MRPKKPFPRGQHQTLKMIDEFLEDCGITVHENCGVQGCNTTGRYRRLRNRFLEIIRFELQKDKRT